MDGVQAPILEDSLKKEVLNRIGLSEETLGTIIKLNEGQELLGISQDIEVKMPITNGHGSKEIGSYTNPFIWSITASVKASVVSPSNGSWRIKITVNDSVVFDESGIVPNKEISAKVKVGGFSKATVRAEAWWSENANTTLVVKGKGSI